VKSFIGKETILTHCPDVLFDESRFSSGIPAKLYYPRTHEDVRAIAREASSTRTPLTVIGAQTGIAGAGVPIDDCIAVCFSEMTVIERLDFNEPGAPVLYCQPGVTVEAISRFLSDPGQWPDPVEGAGALTPGKWMYAPDPTEMTAQLGGTVATNASGARSYFFGPTRAHIVSLTIVFADGSSAIVNRDGPFEKDNCFAFIDSEGRRRTIKRPGYESPAIKNASGYYSKKGMELIDLFIGSEGTLALFTRIGVRLIETPRFTGGLSFFPDRSGAFGFASFLRSQPGVAAIEYFDESALRLLARRAQGDASAIPDFPEKATTAVYWEYMETETAPFEQRLDAWEHALIATGSSFDATWSGFEENEREVLKGFRHAVPERINAAVAENKRRCPSMRKISTDTALPQEHFSKTIDDAIALVTKARLDYALFGHLGDFHLHCNLLPRDAGELDRALGVYEDIMDMTIARGGTVSAEHGIGKIKTRYCAKMYGAVAMEEMARIKTELDPMWLLGRGNLFERLPYHIL
jgi:D-lactate dehydrogenase (cytochrome)